MKYELTCQNSITGQLFDLTTLEGDIQVSSSLLGQPEKFTFTLRDDPEKLKPLSEGSIISFSVDGEGVFYGYLFKFDTNMKSAWNLTAYSGMRYLQNQDTVYTTKQSASQIFETICGIAGDKIKFKVMTPTSFIVPDFLHIEKSYYNMINYAIQLSNINDNKYYFIRDEFGTLVFSEISNHKTDIILGDNSLVTDYAYSTSIDEDTYNTVKITRDNEDTGLRDVWIEFDSDMQRQWGKLQLITTADKEANEASIREKAANLLKWKNRATKTMKISAVGTQIKTDSLQTVADTKKLIAGSGFKLQLDRLGILKDMWIINATHFYKKDIHQFDLEVFV